MKDRQPISAADEQQVLQHFREHQGDEPSAALDARILAAAAAQARQQATRPRGWVRLHAWLFGGAAGMRWSLALGSVALLGLGLGLSLRTLEQAPARYDSPMPAAPALQRYAAPAPQEKAMAESSRLSEREASTMADSAAPMPEAAEAPAPLPDELHEALQQILQLRESKQQAQAAERLDDLRRRYPGVDVEAQLQRLQRADEAPR
jgi:hypothetical protein